MSDAEENILKLLKNMDVVRSDLGIVALEISTMMMKLSQKDREIESLRAENKRLELEAARTSPDYKLRELCWDAAKMLKNVWTGIPEGGQSWGNAEHCLETAKAIEKRLKTMTPEKLAQENYQGSFPVKLSELDPKMQTAFKDLQAERKQKEE